MFQDCFLRYYAARCQTIRESYVQASHDYAPEAIHDVRVEIKQLRAFFRLIEALNPEFPAKKRLKRFRQLFKAAEQLRDAHVQQELTRQWAEEMGIFFNEYDNALKEKELEGRQIFADFIAEFDLEHELSLQKLQRSFSKVVRRFVFI